MDISSIQTFEDTRQDFLHFCQRYGMIAGITWAKAKGSPNPKDTWFELMRESVADCPNDYLCLLWQNTMESGVGIEETGIQESSKSIVSARDHVSGTSQVTAGDSDEVLMGSLENEIPVKAGIIKKNLPQSSHTEGLNQTSKKSFTLVGLFSLTQRLLLSIGVSVYVLLCLCPPYSLYGFRNDTPYKIRYIGHQFYNSYQEGERQTFFEVDVLQFAILSSSILVGTAGAIVIFGPTGRRKNRDHIR